MNALFEWKKICLKHFSSLERGVCCLANEEGSKYSRIGGLKAQNSWHSQRSEQHKFSITMGKKLGR